MSTLELEKQVRRRRKRLRNESPSEMLIEELGPDDMGYDGDIEALHPDGYEEPESETEAVVTPKRKFHSIDDELAARMKHLGSDRSGTNSPMTPGSMRGIKRRVLHEDFPPMGSNENSEFEVMEVPAADHAAKSPPKKRRRKSRSGTSSQRSDASRSRTAHEKHLLKSTDSNDAMDMT